MGSLVEAAEAALAAWKENQIVRIPTQAAWDALTDAERIAEWNTAGSYEFAIKEAKIKEAAFETYAQAALDALYTANAAAANTLISKLQAQRDHGYDQTYVPA